MILQGSPSHLPISNRKVALICLKLNSCAKKKTNTETKFKKKCHFGSKNDGIWPKNDEPLTGSYLLTHFQSKSWTNWSETKFWHKEKTSIERKIFKKYHFAGRNDVSWPKKDDSTKESFPLTYFQSKSCTNLPEIEPLTESYLLTYFQSKSCTNLCELEFWRQKKNAEHRNGNFQKKKAILKAETIEFSGKMMNLRWSLGSWPISTWKALQIFAQKEKSTLKWQFSKKCHFRGRNDGIWPKNDEALIKCNLLTHFQSKSCTTLSESEFWSKKKTSTEIKIFKKYHFVGRNDASWPKNDDSTTESFPSTDFQSKSCTNLPETEF